MADRDAAIGILVDGFFDNPVFSWIFSEEPTRAEALDAWYRFWIDVYGDRARLEIDAGGEGAALWCAPGVPELDGSGVKELVAIVTRYNGDRTSLVMGGLARIPHAPPGHWYLNSIAARRGRRARGVGAALLEPFLARCDAEGLPTHLESSNPRNLSFYHRYGYAEHGPRVDLAEGVPMQPMTRAPGAGG